MSALYIGLMSGTSLDGIDAALVDFATDTPTLIATHLHPLPESLRASLFQLNENAPQDLNVLYSTDVALGHVFAAAVQALLDKANVDAKSIKAIGSHGVTIRHHPHPPHPHTVQIGNAHVLAVQTGIPVVADFRGRELALGRQGAPLAPLLHNAFMRSTKEARAIVNIGGFANISILPQNQTQAIQGFDTGPGNVLMNAWAQQHLHQPFDKDGAWASRGQINANLLKSLLSDAFFKKQPPKSTGRNDFNADWLKQHLKNFTDLPNEDVQATLTELTAVSIVHAIKDHAPQTQTLYVCGGGAANAYLLQRLAAHFNHQVFSTQKINFDPNWIEALLMAWLAYRKLEQHDTHSNAAGIVYPA